MDRNLRLLGIGSGLRSFGLTFVGPFAALYLYREAGIGFLAIGLLLAAISVPPLLWSPFAGALADRAGRRPVLVLSLFGEAGAIALVALAIPERSVALFVLGLAVSGMLATTGGPALSAYVADVAQGSDRTMGFTWLRVGTNIGFAAGVASGGIVVGAFGFGVAALASTTILVLGSLLLAVRLDPSPYDRALTPEAPRLPPPVPRTPATPWGRRLLADRLFLYACLAFALSTLVTSQWNTVYALFSGTRLGLSYAAIGVGFALNGVLVVLGQTSTTKSVLGRRHTTIGIYGTVAYAVGFLLLGAAAAIGLGVFGIFLVATAVITLGENLIMIPLSTLPSNLAPPESIGAYNGVFGTAIGLGGLLSIVVGGAALSLIPDPIVLWIVLIAPTAPAVLLLRWVGGRLPERSNRA